MYRHIQWPNIYCNQCQSGISVSFRTFAIKSPEDNDHTIHVGTEGIFWYDRYHLILDQSQKELNYIINQFLYKSLLFWNKQ